jgi:hypothetical protein
MHCADVASEQHCEQVAVISLYARWVSPSIFMLDCPSFLFPKVFLESCVQTYRP